MHKTMSAASPRIKKPFATNKQSVALNSEKKIDLTRVSKIIQKKVDEELFDKDLAVLQMSTPVADGNLNPLFMNTRQFNMTTVEHATAKL